MKFFLTLVAITVTNINCTSQSTAALPKGYENRYIGNFRCGVFVPPSYDPSKKYPLVIYLHGKSDTVSRNMAWYHNPAALKDPAIVLTPKCPLSETGEWGNSWISKDPPMIKKTFEMIDAIKKQYNIDKDRIYIYGISMGAIGTFGLIQRYPDLFAGGYAVCGWGNPEIVPQLSKIPFWIFHGEQDDVVPVEGSRGVHSAVLAYGGRQIRYTEFKDVKHDAWSHLDNTEIITWLLKQKKGATHASPNEVIGIKAKVNEGNSILLEWKKPLSTSDPDNIVWYYKVYRNNSMIAEVNNESVSYVDSLMEKCTACEYKISAVNYYFKESGLSAPVRVTHSAQ